MHRLATVGLALLLAGHARADSLRIHTEGAEQPIVTLSRNGHVIKHCLGGCTTELMSGRYRVEIAATESGYTYDDEVVVDGR